MSHPQIPGHIRRLGAIASNDALERFVLQTEQTATGSEVDFTGILPTVSQIIVMYRGVSFDGTARPLLKLGTATGIVETGYTSSAGLYNNGSNVQVTSATEGFIMASNVAANLISGHFTLTYVRSNNWVCSHTAKFSTTQTGGGGGDVSLPGTLTQLRLTSTSTATAEYDAGALDTTFYGFVVQ